MVTLIESIFGTYEAISYSVPVLDESGISGYYDMIPSGAAGVDWMWIAGVLLFSIVLWSFFRLVGVLLK